MLFAGREFPLVVAVAQDLARVMGGADTMQTAHSSVPAAEAAERALQTPETQETLLTVAGLMVVEPGALGEIVVEVTAAVGALIALETRVTVLALVAGAVEGAQTVRRVTGLLAVVVAVVDVGARLTPVAQVTLAAPQILLHLIASLLLQVLHILLLCLLEGRLLFHGMRNETT